MRTLLRIAAGAAVIAAGWSPTAVLAHERRAVGPVELVVGWEDEPAYAGFVNAVGVDIERGGAPVTGAKVRVVVIFGNRDGTTKTSAMAMEPAFGRPSHYRAPIVPNRPGTYTFHVTGTAAGTRIDQFFTSGERTFDDIKDPASISFPARDPSVAQLGTRVERSEAKLRDLTSASSRSTIALVVGGIGVLIGIVAVVRR